MTILYSLRPLVRVFRTTWPCVLGSFGVGRKGRGKGLSLLCVTVRGREGGPVRGRVRDGTQPEQEFIRESDCANISPSPESLEVLGGGILGVGLGVGRHPSKFGVGTGAI